MNNQHQLSSFDELLQQPKNDSKFTRKVIGFQSSGLEDQNQHRKSSNASNILYDEEQANDENNARISIEFCVDPWNAALEDILKQLQVAYEHGLSEAECEVRRKRFGKNKLTKKVCFQMFQFVSPLTREHLFGSSF